MPIIMTEKPPASKIKPPPAPPLPDQWPQVCLLGFLLVFVFVFVLVITVVSVFVLVFVIIFVFVFDSATIFVVTQVCFPPRTSRDETRASQLGRQLERWLLHRSSKSSFEMGCTPCKLDVINNH